MKLRNKVTGEITDWCIDKDSFETCDGRIQIDSLAKLNDYWEDVPEEPEEYWYINEFGTPTEAVDFGRETIYDKSRKYFGNYFSTKEEAERAVERLKALKRLEDRGVVLDSFEGVESYENRYRITFSIRCDSYWSDRLHSVDADLNLLFGGED